MKRVISMLLASAAVGAFAVAAAPGASAHAASVTGTASCRYDGSQRVTWTITNDHPLAVDVTRSGGSGGGSLKGLPATIKPATSGNTTTTAVQTDIAGDATTASLTVHGQWTDGYQGDATGTVTLPATCASPTTEVSPATPEITRSTGCDVPDSVTIPQTRGVLYALDGMPLTAGRHEGPLGGEVQAIAVKGFSLTGTQAWAVKLAAATPCPHGIETVAPTVDSASACGSTGSVVVPAVEHVAYLMDGRPLTAGTHPGPLSGTITAVADKGYIVEGTSTWVVAVDAARQCEAVQPTIATAAVCGHPGTLTVPAVPGVAYTLDGAPLASGVHTGPLTGVVRAVSTSGASLNGSAQWPISVAPAVTCATPPVSPPVPPTQVSPPVSPPVPPTQVSPPVSPPAHVVPPAASAVPAASVLSVTPQVATPSAGTPVLASTGVTSQSWMLGALGALLLMLGGGLTVLRRRLV